MSDYQQYLNERNKIDYFIQKGYIIHQVKEHLNGAYVDFFHPEQKNNETILVGTANARKYFSTILLQQRIKKGSEKDEI